MDAKLPTVVKELLLSTGLYRLGKYWLPLWGGLVIVSLACATNTPVAQVATPRPTRTPIPTFTLTAVPPTATPRPTDTSTPLVPHTSTPTETPLPTATPVEPTNTPVPTATPVPPTNTPAPTAVPATATPVPTPTPVPVANSPLATPTFTPEPGTPPGRYEAIRIDGEQNCADIGVTGKVETKGGDDPVPHVTVHVTSDDDDYRGPFIGKTDESGRYSIYIGPIDEVGSVDFEAEIVGGAGVESEDSPEWETSGDCHGDGIQVMEIDWAWKR